MWSRHCKMIDSSSLYIACILPLSFIIHTCTQAMHTPNISDMLNHPLPERGWCCERSGARGASGQCACSRGRTTGTPPRGWKARTTWKRWPKDWSPREVPPRTWMYMMILSKGWKEIHRRDTHGNTWMQKKCANAIEAMWCMRLLHTKTAWGRR